MSARRSSPYTVPLGIRGSHVDRRFTDVTRRLPLPRQTRSAGWRRCARASPGRSTPRHRRAGRGGLRIEKGSAQGDQADIAGEPPRYLPRQRHPSLPPRVTSTRSRKSRFAVLTIARRASTTTFQRSSAWTSLADDWPPKCLAWTSLRPRRRTPAARTPRAQISTWSPPTAAAGLRPVALLPLSSTFGRPSPGGFDITPWADRVRLIDASLHPVHGRLPALGTVAAPTAVLIRPDGYVAWVGDLNPLGLADALTTWFGPPTAA